MNRYEKECKQLGMLAERQLNLPKNAVKQNFEDMSLHMIFMKINEEYAELKEEVINCKTRNYNRIFEELGDTAGCLAGLLAKINKLKHEDSDDGT